MIKYLLFFKIVFITIFILGKYYDTKYINIDLH